MDEITEKNRHAEKPPLAEEGIEASSPLVGNFSQKPPQENVVDRIGIFFALIFENRSRYFKKRPKTPTRLVGGNPR